MNLYLLLAPLVPMLMLRGRGVSSPRHAVAALLGLLLFIPAAVVSTIIRNQFIVQRIGLFAYTMRLFLSDYLVQMLFLIVLMGAVLKSKWRDILAFDSEKAILICICCYFFGEVVYRMLFISLPPNAYELFFFPTIRLILILAVRATFARLTLRGAGGAWRGGVAILSVIAMGALSAFIGALLWYKFLIISVALLVAFAVGAFWLFMRTERAH